MVGPSCTTRPTNVGAHTQRPAVPVYPFAKVHALAVQATFPPAEVHEPVGQGVQPTAVPFRKATAPENPFRQVQLPGAPVMVTGLHLIGEQKLPAAYELPPWDQYPAAQAVQDVATTVACVARYRTTPQNPGAHTQLPAVPMTPVTPVHGTGWQALVATELEYAVLYRPQAHKVQPLHKVDTTDTVPE